MGEYKWLIFVNYMYNNYGLIVGNLVFGMLFGLMGVVGYLFNFLFDICYIVFFLVNVGYVVMSGDLGWVIFW